MPRKMKTYLGQLAEEADKLLNGRAIQQYAAICYRRMAESQAIEVLLITSRTGGRWIIPKGWAMDNRLPHQVAEREAWEEAGIVVTIDYDLGQIEESRPPKSSSKTKSGKREKAVYHFYEATVTSEEQEWPEKDKRQRQWMTYVQAWESLKERPELQEALNRSTMKR